MTEDPDKQAEQKVYNAPDDGKSFDMYHLFSRWDVRIAIVFVLALLIYALYAFFSDPALAL